VVVTLRERCDAPVELRDCHDSRVYTHEHKCAIGAGAVPLSPQVGDAVEKGKTAGKTLQSAHL